MKKLSDIFKRNKQQEVFTTVVPETIETDEYVKEDNIVPLTYVDLRYLKESSNLDVNKRYRITDYTATTTIHDTKSAEHHFDLLLTPISESHFSPDVSALPHDSYFRDCRLSQWEIKYSFENDKERFAWADTKNGKGVIYYMKDEYGNECPYDFKNIMFKRLCVTGGEDVKKVYFGQEIKGKVYPPDCELNYDYGDFYYTFSGLRYGNQVMTPDENLDPYHPNLWICDLTVEPFIADPDIIKDKSVIQHQDRDICMYNVIKPVITLKNQMILNNNVFISYPSFWKEDYDGYEVSFAEVNNNFFDFGCFGNTVCGIAVANHFGKWCKNNTIEKNSDNNRFEYCCSENRLGTDCFENHFMTRSSKNVLNCSSYNVIGNSTTRNTFEHSNHNRLSILCSGNKFDFSNRVSLGVGCRDNVLSMANSNVFGNFCQSNKTSESFIENIVGSGSSHNVFERGCTYNMIGPKCCANTFEENCKYITLAGDNFFFKFEKGSTDIVKELHENGEQID